MVFAIDKAIRRYGSSLILQRGNEKIPFRGFLQHSGSKSWQNMERSFGPVGEIPAGQYVLLAPLEPVMSEGDVLVQGTVKAVIRRIETVMVGDRKGYCWGLCVKTEDE